jgi:hypothetical protein
VEEQDACACYVLRAGARVLDFDQISAAQILGNVTTINSAWSGAALADVFEIDWTVVSAVGLFISSLAACWYARRQ